VPAILSDLRRQLRACTDLPPTGCQPSGLLASFSHIRGREEADACLPELAEQNHFCCLFEQRTHIALGAAVDEVLNQQ
jgi:hypothetical protein